MACSEYAGIAAETVSVKTDGLGLDHPVYAALVVAEKFISEELALRKDSFLPTPGRELEREKNCGAIGNEALDIDGADQEVRYRSHGISRRPITGGGGVNFFGVPLTPREYSCVALLPMADKVIAWRLQISARTVQQHLASARVKIGAGNRGELLAWRLLSSQAGTNKLPANFKKAA